MSRPILVASCMDNIIGPEMCNLESTMNLPIHLANERLMQQAAKGPHIEPHAAMYSMIYDGFINQNMF